MATALRSTPPPAPEARAKRLPLTRMRTPRRFRGRMIAAELLEELMSARGIPNAEVAECMGGGESLVRQLRSGDVAVLVGDVFAMQRRMALAYLDAVRAEVLKPSSKQRIPDSSDDHE